MGINHACFFEYEILKHNAALTGAFALIMAAIATIIRVKRLSNVLLSGSVAERKSPDNRMFGRFPVNAALSGPWSDSGRVLITPASADVKRGALFCFAKNVTLFTVSWMRLLYAVKFVMQNKPLSRLLSFPLFHWKNSNS